MFKLTVQFNIERICKWTKIWTKLWIKWNFELTVFELGGPDLYKVRWKKDCFAKHARRLGFWLKDLEIDLYLTTSFLSKIL